MNSNKITKKCIGDTQFLAGILNSYSNPTVLMNRDYVMVAANEAYQKQYGFKVDGKSHCYEISHHYKKPCDLAGETCPLKLCLESNSAQRSLHVHHTEFGEEHVDVQLSPIHDEQGKIAYFLETMASVKCASTKPQAEGLVGRSIAFNTVIEMVQRVACSDVSVLLQGESGTGKEVVARNLHYHSVRRDKPFVPINCGAIPGELLESELFGNEKGSLTGALYRRKGKLEVANGGTLFLDEIGSISAKTQIDLLRAIELKEFTRLGSNESIKSNFRVVCATNTDLEKAVKEGRFREDLYYRLNVIPEKISLVRLDTDW